MDKSQLEEFKELLLEQKDKLLRNAQQTLEDSVNRPRETGMDSLDESTAESLESTHYRLRDREKWLLKKVNEALKRIEAGDYPYCEECGEEIGTKRLRARAVTTLCIACKEAQEKDESTRRSSGKGGLAPDEEFSY